MHDDVQIMAARNVQTMCACAHASCRFVDVAMCTVVINRIVVAKLELSCGRPCQYASADVAQCDVLTSESRIQAT